MALNLSTLKTRSLTAIFFVVIMLAGLLYNYWSFFFLFSIIHFGCWVEYYKLLGLIDAGSKKVHLLDKIVTLIGGWGFMLMMINQNFEYLNIFTYSIGKWVMIIAVIEITISNIFLGGKNKLKNFFFTLLGFVYISLSFGLMISLRNHGMIFKGQTLFLDFGFALPLLLIVSIWINDTMAYIVGSLIGKNPLSSISPKKTWEGTIGGAVLCVLIISSLVYFYFDKSLLSLALIVSSIAAIFGTMGDLLESKLKRMANVKDSGSFMPGHGGFLDRFDSLLIATPMVWIALKIFTEFLN
ncbi:MAG: phosphatidate cytidylyltransferase [Chitinophagaceae bacterium]|nr:phosphatidate cytidylyltransferase [Chitinophagaceae bacterium]